MVPREPFMRRALALARRGLEAVSPNPMVGAVIVRRGTIIGEGYHRRFGGAHAEVDALGRSGGARGADVYVTLEPCGHHGKTPPCASALVEAGVRRVFYACPDPNPLTSGRGPALLRAAGIGVHEGCLRDESEALNAPYFHWIRTRTPWVILKWAMTLDGKTSTVRGESQWITGVVARKHVQRLRRRVDAILAGTSTVRMDDPLLTARPARGRFPVRVILDRRGVLPLRLRLLSGDERVAGAGRRIYVTEPAVAAARRGKLEARGLEVLPLGLSGRDRGLGALLRALGRQGISQLLVEGGATLAGSFVALGRVQEVSAYIACRVLGGARARGAVDGPGIPTLQRALRLVAPEARRLGADLWVHGRVDPDRGAASGGASGPGG